MYNEWSLTDLYRGIDDPVLENDMALLEKRIGNFKAAVASLSSDDARNCLHKTIVIEEEISVLARRLGSYFNLRRSAHSPDTEGAKYSTRLQNLMASKTKESMVFRKFIGAIPDVESVICGDELLEAYRFRFLQIKKAVSHQLSDEAEDVFARMNLSGG
jgi:oligoendopeptidase F